MRSVNKVIIIGNLTRDPMSKTIGQDRKIVIFTIATNREWITAEGEKKSLAEFHNIVVWGKLANVCDQFLKKGKLVYIEGYLKTRFWESPEGARLSKTEIVAYDMIMLNKRGEFDDSYLPESPEEEIDNEVFDNIPEEKSSS